MRWTADRQLEFLGRLDNQVKLYGLRIELEEIESVLLTHPLVAMAVVTVQTDSGGGPKAGRLRRPGKRTGAVRRRRSGVT